MGMENQHARHNGDLWPRTTIVANARRHNQSIIHWMFPPPRTHDDRIQERATMIGTMARSPRMQGGITDLPTAIKIDDDRTHEEDAYDEKDNHDMTKKNRQQSHDEDDTIIHERDDHDDRHDRQETGAIAANARRHNQSKSTDVTMQCKLNYQEEKTQKKEEPITKQKRRKRKKKKTVPSRLRWQRLP